MSKILLKSSHIHIASEIVNPIFEKIHYAYVLYDEKKEKLLITPVDSNWFTKLYKPTQFLLKERNMKGDKTLGIRQILIDNDLDMEDKELDYKVVEGLNLIEINIK